MCPPSRRARRLSVVPLGPVEPAQRFCHPVTCVRPTHGAARLMRGQRTTVSLPPRLSGGAARGLGAPWLAAGGRPGARAVHTAVARPASLPRRQTGAAPAPRRRNRPHHAVYAVPGGRTAPPSPVVHAASHPGRLSAGAPPGEPPRRAPSGEAPSGETPLAAAPGRARGGAAGGRLAPRHTCRGSARPRGSPLPPGARPCAQARTAPRAQPAARGGHSNGLPCRALLIGAPPRPGPMPKKEAGEPPASPNLT